MAKEGKMPCALSLPLIHTTTLGWPPTCVFITVNEARRYLAKVYGATFQRAS